jgi:hypothetical protein
VFYDAKTINFEIREDKEEFLALEMDAILKRLFMIKDKVPIIDFLNSIFNDNLSYNAEISYGNTEIVNDKLKVGGKKSNSLPRRKNYITFHADLYLRVEDSKETYEYAIEFQTVFDKEIAIRVFRYSFESAISLDYYRDKNRIILNFPEPYLILIEEEKDISDTITLELRVPKRDSYEFDIKVLRYWNYDLEKLYEENLYLLYPLQIFKLRKEMEQIYRRKNADIFSLNSLHSRLIEIANDAVKAIDKAYEHGKIELSTYNEMITALSNLNAYLVDVYRLPEGYEEEVKAMVKTFYDPKVEAKGEVRAKAETLIMLLKQKFGDIDESYLFRIKNLELKALDNILINIFNLNQVEDIEKYLN